MRERERERERGGGGEGQERKEQGIKTSIKTNQENSHETIRKTTLTHAHIHILTHSRASAHTQSDKCIC